MDISERSLTMLTSAVFPALAVVVGLLIGKIRLDGLPQSLDPGFDGTRQRLDDSKAKLMADLARFEQVLDARRKHLEEHL